MKLKDSTGTSDRLVDTWETYWTKFSSSTQAVDILEYFKNEEAEQGETAVQHHLEDYALTTNGNRIGTFPPSIADIRGQLGQLAEKEQAAKKAREADKYRIEAKPESQRAAASSSIFQKFHAELAKHQGKRDAVIAHLRQTQNLNLLKSQDCKAFLPVQAALYVTDSELSLEEAGEIFRAARLPDAPRSPYEHKQRRIFRKRQRKNEIKPVDRQAVLSYAPYKTNEPTGPPETATWTA